MIDVIFCNEYNTAFAWGFLHSDDIGLVCGDCWICGCYKEERKHLEDQRKKNLKDSEKNETDM